MFIEAISTIRFRSAPEHATDLGCELKSIVGDIGAGPDCISYLVARCTIDKDVWVVSSHWSSRNAMEQHFTDPELRRFMELLAGKAVRRIEFNSFINQYATPAQLPVREAT